MNVIAVEMYLCTQLDGEFGRILASIKHRLIAQLKNRRSHILTLHCDLCGSTKTIYPTIKIW